MKNPNRLNLLQFLALRNIVPILVGIFWLVETTLPCLAAEQGETTATVEDSDDSDDWMFDKSTYTNDPKTGRRVDQYKHEKTAYRDPNAWFDSPMGGFPFSYDFFGGFYENYNSFNYFGMWPEMFSQYYFGADGSGYYPYDGDPNDEDNDDLGTQNTKPDNNRN